LFFVVFVDVFNIVFQYVESISNLVPSLVSINSNERRIRKFENETIRSLYNATIRVFVKSSSDGFEYSGTGAIILVRQQFKVITAKHVLTVAKNETVTENVLAGVHSDSRPSSGPSSGSNSGSCSPNKGRLLQTSSSSESTSNSESSSILIVCNNVSYFVSEIQSFHVDISILTLVTTNSHQPSHYFGVSPLIPKVTDFCWAVGFSSLETQANSFYTKNSLSSVIELPDSLKTKYPPPTISSCIVTNMYNNEGWSDYISYEGFSGAPILDEHGSIVGIHTSMMYQNTKDPIVKLIPLENKDAIEAQQQLNDSNNDSMMSQRSVVKNLYYKSGAPIFQCISPYNNKDYDILLACGVQPIDQSTSTTIRKQIRKYDFLYD
jgi:hypothetical protein